MTQSEYDLPAVHRAVEQCLFIAVHKDFDPSLDFWHQELEDAVNRLMDTTHGNGVAALAFMVATLGGIFKEMGKRL